VRDELFAQLRDLETLAREVRQLLQQEPGAVEQAKGEEALRIAAVLLAARDTNATLAPLHQELYLRALRRAADRSVEVRDAAQADLERALGGDKPTAALLTGGPGRRRKSKSEKLHPDRPTAATPVGFEELHQRMEGEVYALFQRFVRDSENVEDLTVETLVSVWKIWDTLRESPYQEAHVYRTAFGKLLTYFGGRVPDLKDHRLLALVRSVREFERQITQTESGGGTASATVDRLVGDFYAGLFPLPEPKPPTEDGNEVEMPPQQEEPFRESGEGPPAGGSGVPVAPVPVPVLAGGAARTFEEAQEPPRNP